MLHKLLVLCLFGLLVGCDSADPEPPMLTGTWHGEQRAPTFGSVFVAADSTCTPDGCFPVLFEPEVVAHDVRLHFDGTTTAGNFLVERTTAYFMDADAPTDTLATFSTTYEGRYTTAADTLRFEGGLDSPPLLYVVGADSLALRLAPSADGVIVISGECGPGSAAPPECGGGFERVLF